MGAAMVVSRVAKAQSETIIHATSTISGNGTTENPPALLPAVPIAQTPEEILVDPVVGQPLGEQTETILHTNATTSEQHASDTPPAESETAEESPVPFIPTGVNEDADEPPEDLLVSPDFSEISEEETGSTGHMNAVEDDDETSVVLVVQPPEELPTNSVFQSLAVGETSEEQTETILHTNATTSEQNTSDIPSVLFQFAAIDQPPVDIEIAEGPPVPLNSTDVSEDAEKPPEELPVVPDANATAEEQTETILHTNAITSGHEEPVKPPEVFQEIVVASEPGKPILDTDADEDVLKPSEKPPVGQVVIKPSEEQPSTALPTAPVISKPSEEQQAPVIRTDVAQDVVDPPEDLSTTPVVEKDTATRIMELKRAAWVVRRKDPPSAEEAETKSSETTIFTRMFVMQDVWENFQIFESWLKTQEMRGIVPEPFKLPEEAPTKESLMKSHEFDPHTCRPESIVANVRETQPFHEVVSILHNGKIRAMKFPEPFNIEEQDPRSSVLFNLFAASELFAEELIVRSFLIQPVDPALAWFMKLNGERALNRISYVFDCLKKPSRGLTRRYASSFFKFDDQAQLGFFEPENFIVLNAVRDGSALFQCLLLWKDIIDVLGGLLRSEELSKRWSFDIEFKHFVRNKFDGTPVVWQKEIDGRKAEFLKEFHIPSVPLRKARDRNDPQFNLRKEVILAVHSARSQKLDFVRDAPKNLTFFQNRDAVGQKWALAAWAWQNSLDVFLFTGNRDDLHCTHFGEKKDTKQTNIPHSICLYLHGDHYRLMLTRAVLAAVFDSRDLSLWYFIRNLCAKTQTNIPE